MTMEKSDSWLIKDLSCKKVDDCFDLAKTPTAAFLEVQQEDALRQYHRSSSLIEFEKLE